MSDPISILFMVDVGGPATADMLTAVTAWRVAESGSGAPIGANPWNLHIGPSVPETAGYGVPGFRPSQRLSSASIAGLLGNRYAGPGDTNVAIFDTIAHGVQAVVGNLVAHGSDFAGYDHVLASARAGDPFGFMSNLARSAWSAGHYGSPSGDLASNRIYTLYLSLGGTPAMFPVVTLTPYPDGPRTVTIPAGTTLAGYDPAQPGRTLKTSTWTNGSSMHADAEASVAWIGTGTAPIPKGGPFLRITDGVYAGLLVIKGLVQVAAPPPPPAPAVHTISVGTPVLTIDGQPAGSSVTVTGGTIA